MLLDFVGYWPAQSSVVVAYQGTNPKEMYVAIILNLVPTHEVQHSLDILIDLDVHLIAPDRTLFPRIPTTVEVHRGFAEYHMKSANQILAEVRKLMAEHSSTNVVLVRLYHREEKDKLIQTTCRLFSVLYL